jgi:2-hydroxy-3-keto-5-methylthiopentenyl-1-phosphate phosphatase
MSELDNIEKIKHENKINNLEIIKHLNYFVENINLPFEQILLLLLKRDTISRDNSSQETLETIKENRKKFFI